MSKNLATLAEMDNHDCKGFMDGCQVCTTAFYSRSRQKWNRFLEKMERVKQNKRQIDSRIVAAIMAPDTEEDQ